MAWTRRRSSSRERSNPASIMPSMAAWIAASFMRMKSVSVLSRSKTIARITRGKPRGLGRTEPWAASPSWVPPRGSECSLSGRRERRTPGDGRWARLGSGTAVVWAPGPFYPHRLTLTGRAPPGGRPVGEGAMRRLSLSILVLIATLSACSKHSTDSTAPPAAPPVPELVAMHPPARSPSAIYDTDIWAQFDRPLDRRTLDTLNVYLKLDGQRTWISVGYDSVTRRVTITPKVVLELQRTYTVEFST